jgi:hypothetical protein
MSQKRQDARRAAQERRRQERRAARVQQRRAQAAAATATTARPGPTREAVAARKARTTRLLKIAGGAVGGVIVAAIVGFLVWQQFRPLPGTEYPSNGNAHVTPGEPHGAYFSNPPTSGWHYADIPKPGIYTRPREPEELGHFMEHGGVWVLYTCPDGCPEDVEQLKQIVDSAIDRDRPVALAPFPPADTPERQYPKPAHKINVVAWQWLLGLDSVDKAKIEDFIGRHACRYNPEGGPYCGGTRGSARAEVRDAGDQGYFAIRTPTATPAPLPTLVPTSPTPAPPTTPPSPQPTPSPTVVGPTPPPR